MKKTKQLIKKIEHAIENHNVEDAVTYDSQLNENKRNMMNELYNNSKLHSQQMEYIKNFMMMYSSSQLYKLIGAISSFLLFFHTEGTMKYGWLMIAIIAVYFAFVEFGRNIYFLNNFKYLINRMNNEKFAHSKILKEIDTIEEFQYKTESKIKPLYEQYSHQNPSPLTDILTNHLKDYEKLQEENIDNSSDN